RSFRVCVVYLSFSIFSTLLSAFRKFFLSLVVCRFRLFGTGLENKETRAAVSHPTTQLARVHRVSKHRAASAPRQQQKSHFLAPRREKRRTAATHHPRAAMAPRLGQKPLSLAPRRGRNRAAEKHHQHAARVPRPELQLSSSQALRRGMHHAAANSSTTP
ncbi:Unknown protein, partial [Striga hermonthica]